MVTNIKNIPSLSTLLLSTWMASSVVGCGGCPGDKNTRTATEAQTEAPEQTSETKATDTAEGDGAKASVQFKQMNEEQRRSLLEALGVVLADSATLETLKKSPLVYPEHEIDKADSPTLKAMGKALCKTFKGKPYVEATTLSGFGALDWESTKKKLSRLKALNKIAEAYQLPCELAQRIAVDLLQGADFSVLDALDELQQYEKEVLGMHDGQNLLRADNKFSPPLEGIKQFNTTEKFLKLLNITLKEVLDNKLGQVVVNNTKAAFGDTIGAPGTRGGAWDDNWEIQTPRTSHRLPKMDQFLKGQNPYTPSEARFGQLFFAVFGGDNPSSGDCFNVELISTGGSTTKVKEAKLFKQSLMNIISEARKSEEEFAQFLGERLNNQSDLQEIFPVFEVKESYGEFKKFLSDQLSETDTEIIDADIATIIQKLAQVSDSSVSIDSSTIGTNLDNTNYDATVKFLNVVNSAHQQVANAVLGAIKTRVGTLAKNPSGKISAFAKFVNREVEKQEDKFLLKKEGNTYKPTNLTKVFQDGIKDMESEIAAKNKGSSITYQEMSSGITPAFDVTQVHAMLKEAVADLRLYLQLPSSLQSVLATTGAKGAVNYAQILNMPGLSKQQVNRLDDIRMKFQQRVASSKPAPAQAG